MNLNELKEYLSKIVDEGCWEIEGGTIVEDYAGGNMDDAFYGGQQVGRVYLAEEILGLLNKE